MKRLEPLVLSGLLTVCTLTSAAQESSLPTDRRTMTAVRMQEDESISLDGRLDEPVWQRAEPATDFIQQDPNFGGTPTERTEVRIVFDRQRLYMGVTCFDSEPDRLLGNTMKRDEFLSADDRFMWTMDTFLDQQTGYFFEMNPSGLMADSLMGSGGGNDRAWDGIWNARVRRSEIGWTLEIEIPFRTLNFDPDGKAWGINFQRTIRRKNEENLWTGHLRNQGLRRMSNAGLLLGITEASQGLGLDVKPYVTATLSEAPGADEVVPLDGTADVGIDLFYNLTSGLRANLTVNTDFAQTEVDQRLVNLTRFPLFFPEKRDFFLDGSTFFDFYIPRTGQNRNIAVQPFFSRSIGLDEDGQPQKIDFGMKLTGQLGAQDIGVLFVRTGNESDVIGEDFPVMRVKRRLFAQSHVGAIYTARLAREGATPDLHTAGLDFRLATSTFRGSENLELNGFLLWNTNPLGSGNNLGYGARLNYPNDPWSGSLSFIELQAELDPAVGFTPRNNYRGYAPILEFAPRPRGHRWIRRLAFGVQGDLRTDLGNRFLTRNLDVKILQLDTHSQDTVELHVIPSFERLEDDFEIHEGVVLPVGDEYAFTRYRLQARTANRRILATNSSVEIGDFFSGDRKEVVVNLGVRPRTGIVVNLETEWNRVRLPEGSFETRLYRLVTDVQFNPWIYLVNNLQFDSVSSLLGWQARLRWIVTPGNDFYFVYSHNWQEDAVRDRFFTQDRSAAAKFVYTHRF